MSNAASLSTVGFHGFQDCLGSNPGQPKHYARFCQQSLRPQRVCCLRQQLVILSSHLHGYRSRSFRHAPIVSVVSVSFKESNSANKSRTVRLLHFAESKRSLAQCASQYAPWNESMFGFRNKQPRLAKDRRFTTRPVGHSAK
jgi:hypothetical protein